MKSKFLNVYNLAMESINSKRNPIIKVDQMKPKEFLAFLKELLPYIKNGKVNLNDVRISEKVDGNAIRLLTKNGEMLFESAYSGVTTYNEFVMKDAGEYLYTHYSSQFKNIYKSIGFDFKIIGELIWIEELEKSDKVTPVGASYLTEKFGTHGGIVIFDILKIDNDELTQIPKEKEDEIFHLINNLNDEDFSFYLMDAIDITENVTFDLDVDELEQLIENPDFNKERFNRIKDAKILGEIEKIKSNVCSQLSKTIENTKGTFSAEGDLIEGIVVKILSSGNQYGMFSAGYKAMKEKYWQKFDNFEKILDEFYKSIFGYGKKNFKRYIKDFNDSYKQQFNKAKIEYIPVLTNLLNDIKNDKTIPVGVKSMSLSMGQKELSKIKISWNDFKMKNKN